MESCLYFEVKKLLQCATCVIWSSDEFYNSQAVTTETSIQLSTDYEVTTWDLSHLHHMLEAGCKFVNDGESPLTFRVKTYKKTLSLNATISLSESQTKLVDMLSTGQHIVCRCCEMKFLDTSEYSRVLPLPSSGWSEMVDSWYCHQPCSSVGSDQSLALTHKPDDLLVGTYSMLTRQSKLHHAVSDSTSYTCVVCQGCKTEVGHVTPSSDVNNTETNKTVELYHSRLGYMQDKRILHSLICLETTLAAHLLEHCQNMMTYRVVLEYKLDGKLVAALLVWVLQTDLQLVFGDSDGTVEYIDAMKVLYITGSKAEPKVIADWLRDNKVSSIAMSQADCSCIEQVLVDSTKRLPPSMSRIDSMSIGFLKTELVGTS